MTAVPQPTPSVAYLVSEYPKLSHSFVASEIGGVRAAGINVDTYTVRAASEADLLTEQDRAEARATISLIQTVIRRPMSVLRLALTRPDVVARGVWEASRFCAPSVRGRSVFYLLEALALVLQMSKRDARHIHVHLANNSADVAHLAVTMGRRLDGQRWTWSLAVHGPNELNDVGAYNLARKVSSADFVACISHYCRSQLMALVPRAHWIDLHVVRMGIDPDLFTATKRAGRGDGPVNVLFVGRLVAEKAPQLIVAAVAAFPPGTFAVRMVGSGQLHDELISQVRSADLEGHIELVGAVAQPDLPVHYRWADVFCLPSFAEGLPVVLMEAMATGLPVISTQVAGIPELVQDDRNGLLIPAGNQEALIQALARIRDQATRERLGNGNRDRVHEQYHAHDNACRLAKLLRPLCDKDEPSGQNATSSCSSARRP